MMTTDTFDGRNDVIKTVAPTGEVDTAVFDGAGRETNTAVLTPTGTVVSSVASSYDADGDPTLTTTTQANPNGSPLVTYARDYYDAADRGTASVNFGTNGALANQYVSAPPTRAVAGALVTSETYDSGGFENSSVDPAGVVTSYINDSLGRHADVLEYTPGAPLTSDLDTSYTYDGMNNITQAYVANYVPPAAAGGQITEQDQVTNYIYSNRRLFDSTSLHSSSLPVTAGLTRTAPMSLETGEVRGSCALKAAAKSYGGQERCLENRNRKTTSRRLPWFPGLEGRICTFEAPHLLPRDQRSDRVSVLRMPGRPARLRSVLTRHSNSL